MSTASILQLHEVPKKRQSSDMASAMGSEFGVNGLYTLQLVNRLNESRSPYVSPHCVASKPTRKRLKLRCLSHRFEDT